MAYVVKVLEDQAIVVEDTINKLCHRIVKDIKTLKGKILSNVWRPLNPRLSK